MVVCLRRLYYHILSVTSYSSWEKWSFVSITIVHSMVCASNCVHYGVNVIFFNLYIISFSSPCRLIWKHWPYHKMLVSYILSSVRLRLSEFSHLSWKVVYGCVCFQLTYFSCDNCENIYTLSYYHYQIGNINNQLLFKVRSWNIGICCMHCYALVANFITYKKSVEIISKKNMCIVTRKYS